MKVILVSDNEEIKQLLSFQMSSANPISVKECASSNAAVELLRKNDATFDLVVAPYNGPDSSLIQYLKQRKDPMPIIFFFDSMIAKPEGDALAGLLVVGSVEQNGMAAAINSLVRDFIHRGGVVGPASDFCPIRTNLLIRTTPLKSDIFIRLSADKYLKLFKTGDEFDHADLEKYYESKGVEYMYLRRNETAEFIEKFGRELDQLLAKPDLKQEEAFEAVEMSQETIHELVQRIGFTEEVQELAKKNVQLTLKIFGTNPRLIDILNKVINDGNYISQHSTLLAHVSCCLAKEMEWGSESTFSKLVLASFLHDISLTNPELSKINSMKELESRRSEFPEEEAKGYHLHPARSADMVRTFKEIPSDIDLIVQQHHERPNGGGFPRGLAHNYIAPLSALFIISHDLAQAILLNSENFSLENFVEEKKPLYGHGNFKKVMTALEKMKL